MRVRTIPTKGHVMRVRGPGLQPHEHQCALSFDARASWFPTIGRLERQLVSQGSDQPKDVSMASRKVTRVPLSSLSVWYPSVSA